MSSPLPVRVRVDGQGRMVLPLGLRGDVVTVPGEVLVQRTAEGLLMTAADAPGVVGLADDGLPILAIGRRITTSEVLAAIDAERADR